MYWFWRARLHCINIKANWVKPTCSRHIQYIYYKIIIYNTLYYYVIYSNCISSNIRNAAFTVLKWIHVNTCTYLQTEYTCRYPFETFERDSSEIQASQISETWAKIEHGNNERDTAVRKCKQFEQELSRTFGTPWHFYGLFVVRLSLDILWLQNNYDGFRLLSRRKKKHAIIIMMSDELHLAHTNASSDSDIIDY